MTEKGDETKKELSNENMLGERSAGIQRVALVSSSPSARSIFRVVIIVLLLLAVKDFLGSVISSLTFLFFMIVLAILLAYLINPLVTLIQRPFTRFYARAMPRALAIALAFLIVFSVIGISVYSLAPIVTQQARTFIVNVPTYTTAIQSKVSDFNQRLDRMRISETVQKQINDRINIFLDGASTFMTTLLGLGAIYAVTYLPWLILVPILAFFFLKDAILIRTALLRMVPAGDWRARVESVVVDVNNTLTAYTRAQLISCVLIGVICTAGFYLLGHNYAVLLGILAAVLELIPLLGPLTLAIVATIFAGFESGWQALWTAVFLGGLRIVHDYYTYPRIVREGIHLHPLAVILSVLAGEQAAGIAGVFIAIPLVALLTVLYKHVMEHSGRKGLLTGLLEPSESKEASQEQ